MGNFLWILAGLVLAAVLNLVLNALKLFESLKQRQLVLLAVALLIAGAFVVSMQQITSGPDSAAGEPRPGASEQQPSHPPSRSSTPRVTPSATPSRTQTTRTAATPTAALPSPPRVAVVLTSKQVSIPVYAGGDGPGMTGYIGGIYLAGAKYGLSTGEGAQLVAFSRNGRTPKLTDCAAIPAETWAVDIPTAQLKTGHTYCLVSPKGRYGYFTIRGRETTTNGDLKEVSLTCLVWKGPDDPAS